MIHGVRSAQRQQGNLGATLEQTLEPAGSAVAVIFRQTALAAVTPDNQEAMALAGDAFGRLVHLLDAVTDRDADRRHGRYNPLDATCTSDEDAHALARRLHETMLAALASSRFADRSLVDALFGATLAAAVERPFRSAPSTAHGKKMRQQFMLPGVVASVAIPASFARCRRPIADDVVPAEGCFVGCAHQLACDCCANACRHACCNSF